MNDKIHRKRHSTLGVVELIAIALGGMVGGGIFTILGISVEMIGVFTPVAIIIGGVLAYLAAYSYIKLGVYYQDEGASYSFVKRTFPHSPLAASLVGWWVIFGYISTVALYAYTFSSYAISSFEFADNEWIRKLVAAGIITLFTLINIWSVKGMGKIEDLMVYTKLIILVIISFVLINHSQTSLPVLFKAEQETPFLAILIVSSLTFVAYEGFQLVINAVNEMDKPETNIPKAIYSALFIAVLIYVVISLGAILAIPFNDIIENKEYALAAGAEKTLGHWGSDLIIIGALLATSSAISATVFGASRQMSVIAKEGYFPPFLAKRSNTIPTAAMVILACLAILLVVIADLEMILEFSSVTFLVVSLIITYANYTIHQKTQSSLWMTCIAMLGLTIATGLIIYYEATHQIEQLYFIFGIYCVLSLAAWFYAKKNNKVITAT
ncbi:MAG: amino acid permease [Gammaproteobacteria bacterium]|nr:MAG: amino acid permease [Gammaproteobacteria bacterium]